VHGVESGLQAAWLCGLADAIGNRLYPFVPKGAGKPFSDGLRKATSLIRFNGYAPENSASAVQYDASGALESRPLGTAGVPQFSAPNLRFTAEGARLELHNAVAHEKALFFGLAITFSDLALVESERRVLFSKAGSGAGYSLTLERDASGLFLAFTAEVLLAGDVPATLVAKLEDPDLTVGDSVLLWGAFDGATAGLVLAETRAYDNVLNGSQVIPGNLRANSEPVTLGGDPSGPGSVVHADIQWFGLGTTE
jgi:hypothetical protein